MQLAALLDISSGVAAKASIRMAWLNKAFVIPQIFTRGEQDNLV